MLDSILNIVCDNLRKWYLLKNKNIIKKSELTIKNLFLTCIKCWFLVSGQLEFLVCLRAGQFGQSVKPKVNISHCLRQPNVCPWLWLWLRVRPSRGPLSHHPRTIPWPAAPLLLGQHWTQFRKCGPPDTWLTLTSSVWPGVISDYQQWRRIKMESG